MIFGLLKKCLSLALVTGTLFCSTSTCLAQPIDPLSLHFRKDYQVRNFYNSSVQLSKLDLSLTTLEESRYPTRHLTSPGCDFKLDDEQLHISNNTKSEQHSYLDLGKLYNYAAIDLDIQTQKANSAQSSVLLVLYKDEANKFILKQNAIGSADKRMVFEIVKEGELVFSQTLAEEGVAAPNTLRIHLTGKFLNVLLVKNGDWTILGSFDVSEHFELRDKSVLASFSFLVGAKLGSGDIVTITKAEQYLTTGTAQADPRILHYEDGAPMIEGNMIWVAMTTRGYGTQLYQGIYSYDLVSKEWQVTGTLVFNKGDGLIRQWAASDVFFDRKSESWKVFTVSHRDDHMLYAGETKKDLRFGLTEIASAKVKYESVGNEEDPSVIWDAEVGKWRMVMCKAKKGYQTILMEADEWDGEWRQTEVYEPTSSTGVLIQKIGGKRYVFIGRGKSPCPLEVLTYPGLKKVGELNLSEHPVGKNIWPAIFPVSKKSGTAYYLLTFDRDAWTGQRTYGNIHWYEAEEFAKDFWEE